MSRAALASLAGKLVSMRLALPSASVWTRSMLREAARERGEGDASVDAEMVDEWSHWERVLSAGRPLRMPIRAPESEVELSTDASTVGWGAHMCGMHRSGWFPSELVDSSIGSSSAARELSALVCAAHEFREELRGRRLRVVMDAKAAVANLTKGGAPCRSCAAS